MHTSNERSYFLLALLLGSAVVSFFIFRPFLTIIALAAIFAVILHPLFIRIRSYLRGHDSISALATLVIGCLFIIVPITLIGTLIVNQSQEAYGSLIAGADGTSVERATLTVGSWLEPYVPGATEYARAITVELSTYAEQALRWLIEHVGVAFSGILSFVLYLLIFLMSLFYFIKEGVALQNLIVKKNPLKDEEGEIILKRLGKTITSVVKGSLTVACAQGLLAGIGFAIFGVPNSALWGASTAVAALVPGVGTTLVIIPVVIYLFAIGNVGQAIGLLAWGLLLVGLIDNFLGPKLISSGAQLHPLVIMLSILGGVIFYGPAGIFLGPLTVSLLYAVYTVYATHYPVPESQ